MRRSSDKDSDVMSRQQGNLCVPARKEIQLSPLERPLCEQKRRRDRAGWGRGERRQLEGQAGVGGIERAPRGGRRKAKSSSCC